jgi:hypothetical protein
MNGTTLTVQSKPFCYERQAHTDVCTVFKQKFLDSFAYDFEPRTAMIAEIDMIPKEIYGL